MFDWVLYANLGFNVHLINPLTTNIPHLIETS